MHAGARTTVEGVGEGTHDSVNALARGDCQGDRVNVGDRIVMELLAKCA